MECMSHLGDVPYEECDELDGQVHEVHPRPHASLAVESDQTVT